MKCVAFIKALKFVSHAKAKNDVRYYLNAVHFEFTGGLLTMVATDGHRMAVVEVAAPDMPDAQYLLSGADIDVLLKAVKPDLGSTMLHPREKRVEFHCGTQVINCAEVDGKFPDWRRVVRIDAKPKGTPIYAVNAEYLAQAAKSCAVLTGKYAGVELVTYGDDANSFKVRPHGVEVVDVNDAYVVVMPMRR